MYVGPNAGLGGEARRGPESREMSGSFRSLAAMRPESIYGGSPGGDHRVNALQTSESYGAAFGPLQSNLDSSGQRDRVPAWVPST